MSEMQAPPPPNSPKIDPGEKPRLTVTGDVAWPGTQPWWKSPQILWALSSMAGGVTAFCHGFHITLPFTELELTLGMGGLASTLGSGYWLYKRIRLGKDPASPAKQITLL